MRRFKGILLSTVVCVLAGTEATAQQRLPLLQNVGIIPVQWEGDALAPGAAQKMSEKLNDSFFGSIKKSQRFRVLNDELVKGNWNTAEGRSDLVDNYELQALVVMNAAVNNETVRLVARLVSPQMTGYLTESDAHSLNKLNGATKDEMDDIVRNLVYRLFNRLPIDVTVTSVQGRYVSLSGGSGQNLRVGDEVAIKRPQVSTLHPADSSWLTFRSQEQGKIKVVDVKPQTAVGLITAQTYDGAIGVGDGLKVSDIPGRKFFVQSDAKQQFVDSGDDIVVRSPNYQGKLNNKPDQGKPAPAPQVAQHNNKPNPQPVQEPEQTQPAAETDEEPQYSPSTVERAPGKLDHEGVNFYVGIENWSTSGAAKTESQLSMLLFNYFGASIRMPLNRTWDVEVGGALRYGSTKNGDFSGLMSNGRLIYPLDLDLGLNARVRVGGEAMLETYAVNDETFGGGDYVMLGALGGLEGTSVLIERNVQWVADLTVRPFAIGQIGYGGSKKSLGSFFGYSLRGELLFLERGSQLSWGGGLDINGFDAQAGKKLSYSEFMISGIARYKF